MIINIKYDKNIVSGIEKDNQLKHIENWWLELDNKGSPIREIGFNESKTVIYVAPLGKDYGLWSDAPLFFENPDEYDNISLREFESVWNNFLSDRK